MTHLQITHLVPSGAKESFCKLKAKDIDSSSLGMLVNCDKCLEILQSYLFPKRILCQVGSCTRNARYIVGIDKMNICLGCFEGLPDNEKSELYNQKLIKKITEN